MVALAKLLGPGGDLETAAGKPVEVLWQTGCTPVDDLPIQATPFLPAADLNAALLEADIVVSHAGTGSALANLAAGRFAVMTTRLAAFGEAGDDHQAELATELAARGLALHRAPDAITADGSPGHAEHRRSTADGDAAVRAATRPGPMTSAPTVVAVRPDRRPTLAGARRGPTSLPVHVAAMDRRGVRDATASTRSADRPRCRGDADRRAWPGCTLTTRAATGS